jgi:hypothetical protein
MALLAPQAVHVNDVELADSPRGSPIPGTVITESPLAPDFDFDFAPDDEELTLPPLCVAASPWVAPAMTRARIGS